MWIAGEGGTHTDQGVMRVGTLPTGISLSTIIVSSVTSNTVSHIHNHCVYIIVNPVALIAVVGTVVGPAGHKDVGRFSKKGRVPRAPFQREYSTATECLKPPRGVSNLCQVDTPFTLNIHWLKCVFPHLLV